MWRLLLVASLALCFNFKVNSSIIDATNDERSIDLFGGDQSDSDLRNAPSKKPTYASEIIKIINELIAKKEGTQTVDDMVKRMEKLSRKFPKKLMRDKSLKAMSVRFKKNYDDVLKQTKVVVRTAKNLEKIGEKATQKQLDAYALKVVRLDNQIEKFTKSFDGEVKKQRNRNLKIIENNQNDVRMVENAKRFINIADTFSACVQWIQSIPSNINCYMFGICEPNADDDAGQEDNDDDEDEDTEEEEEEDDEGDEGDDGGEGPESEE